jgi:hypothetical protein
MWNSTNFRELGKAIITAQGTQSAVTAPYPAGKKYQEFALTVMPPVRSFANRFNERLGQRNAAMNANFVG